MKKTLFSLLLFACAVGVRAQIRLQPMFSDNMVLQQNTKAPIWGEAGAGRQVRVTTSWNKRVAETVAQADGKWKVTMDTPKAGGPYEIKIEEVGGSTVTLRNVLIGEVWLCTGQSNMEMPLAAWGFIDNYEQEIANADNYPRIRLINMKHVISPLPKTDIAAQTDGWEVCSSKTVPGFSAAGYFFGVNLQKSLGVPIGLIATNWGGTLAESWTSEESLMQMPYFRDLIQKVKSMPASMEEQRRQYEQDDRAFWATVAEGEKGVEGGQYLWAAPDLNDATWGTIAQPGKVEENGLSGFDGVVWIRRAIDIPTAWEGKALTLSLGPVDDEDITFFNGVEIGRNDLWFAPRSYTIPAELVKAGRASIAIRIMDTGADGGLTAGADQLYLQPAASSNLPPLGEAISLAGEWKYRVANDLRNYPPRPVNMAGNPNLPTVLYNSMLNPLVGYSLRGAIWYQGESNVDRAAQYRELLPVMINDWRTKWNAPLDFYIVQLANFMRQQTEPEESTWAELREAQMLTAQHLDHTGIACAIDIGMDNDIHPKNKQEVGRRLALAALAQTYGKKIAYSGPVYKCYRIEGDKIRLYFDHVGKGFQMTWPNGEKKELRLDDQRLNSAQGSLAGGGGPFTIAGADKKFHWAEWMVEGETIVVWSPEVKFPVSVRYGWANNPDTKSAIYNTDGLPMFPFRTDQWPAITTLTAQ
ncbi:MAG: 9-O-acetylesterase [Prevotella sp.]|nr:9-O-acetylesterase [Prevotella sp.]